MNINDLPKGSYQPVNQPQGLNINNLPQGSYMPTTPSGSTSFNPGNVFAQSQATQASPLSQQIWSGIASAAKSVESPFASIAATPVQLAAKALGQPDPYANNAAGLNISPLDPRKKAGDVLQAGATVGAVAAAPASLGGALLTGAGIGAAQGAGSALSQGASNQDVLTQGLTGAVAGGATAGTVSGVGKLLSALPNRLVQSALPKLDEKNIPTALSNTHLGSIDSMLAEAKTNVSTLGSHIHSVLTHSTYATHLGNGGDAIQAALDQFPKSEYTADHVIAALKSVVPGYAKSVTDLAKGTATLPEKNELRQAIDAATKKIFTDTPQVSATKQLAAAVASSIRDEVQTVAPQTAPMFQELSKEINLRNALQATAKKLDKRSPINLFSLLSFLSAGLPAAMGEEFARSPAVSIATAKGASVLGPALQKAAPLLSGVASKSQSAANQQPQ